MSPEESDQPGLSRFHKLLSHLEMDDENPAFGPLCVAFMLESLSRIERRLPAFGRELLDEARRAHTREGERVDLERQRIRCWQAVDFAELLGLAVEANALRALLFVLPPPSSEDLFDYIDVFIAFAIRAGLHHDEIERIFRRHFGDWLPVAIA